MSEGNAAPSGSTPGTPLGRGTPKAIPSMAKKQSETTRTGTPRLTFTPRLPSRRTKEDVKQESTSSSVPSTSTPSRGRGRGSGRGRGDGNTPGRGRGSNTPRPSQEMTASGPFAMGPALAGASAPRRGPQHTHTPITPLGPGHASALGAGLTKSAGPMLKRERKVESALKGAKSKEEDAEVYSDPEDGIEIIDMENVRSMDWMAPESLKKEREGDKRRRKAERMVRAEGETKPDKGKGVAKQEPIEIDSITPSMEGTPATVGEVDLANALDLSESEDEEEMEDLIEDFAANNAPMDEGTGLSGERLYFFQFPAPFPAFVSRTDFAEPMVVDKGKAPEGSGSGPTLSPEKRVSFAQDTKPAAGVNAPGPMQADSGTQQETHVDGLIGQLEIYESGAVKMRLHNGILLDVSAATQPSFLQQAVHIDRRNKHMNVLGEVSRRFVVTPNVDALLDAMAQADRVAIEDEASNAMDTI